MARFSPPKTICLQGFILVLQAFLSLIILQERKNGGI